MGLLIIKGQVFTGLPPYNEPKEAILIKDDTILFVGSYSEALKKVNGENIEELDFGDHLITPGLIDSHCHLSLAGLYAMTGVDLRDVTSFDEIKEKIRSEIKAGKSIVYAYGFDESSIGKTLSRWELDEIDSSTPIIVEHISGHMLIANSEALRRAGIRRDTPNPPGGLIERDESGEPTGILKDSAMNLILKILPSPTMEDWIRGIEKAQEMWLRGGFTSIEDTGTFGSWDYIFKAYRTLDERGELKLRVRVAYTISNASESKEALKRVQDSKGYESEHLKTNLIKLFYDGSGLARTALLYEDWCYNGKPLKGFKGIRTFDPKDLEKVLHLFLNNNIRVAIHAIGDRAVDEIITSYMNVFERRSFNRCALSIIHAILVSQKALDLLGPLGICIKTQPNFMYTHGHIYASNLCESRSRRAFPLRSFLKKGVTVAGSTDAPFVGRPNASEGIYGAMFRKPRIRHEVYSFGKEESITFTEALLLYTAFGAKAIGMDDLVGTLSPGKKADLVVWNLRTLEPTEDQVLNMKPLKVFVGGKVVVDNL